MRNSNRCPEVSVFGCWMNQQTECLMPNVNRSGRPNSSSSALEGETSSTAPSGTPSQGAQQPRARPPVPATPAFLARMRQEATNPRPSALEKLVELEEANVKALASAVHLAEQAVTLANRSGNLTPRHESNLQQSEHRHRMAEQRLQNLRTQQRQSMASHEQAMESIDRRFAEFELGPRDEQS